MIKEVNNETTTLEGFKPNLSDFLEVSKGDIEKEIKKQIGKLKRGSSSVLPFPVEVFPQPVQNLIHEFNKAFKLPVDYYGLGILTVCSAAIGNAFCLKYSDTYKIPAVLYSAIVGKSSIGKTPVLKLCLSPVFKIEQQYKFTYKAALDEWHRENVKNKGKSTKPKPTTKELMINDATIEAVNKSMSRNPKGLLLFQDELMAWINNLNRYRKGSDVQFWLMGWGNSSGKVNRADKPPMYVNNLFVSVLGGIQPKLLEGLGEGNKKDNGFLYRILLAYPDEQKKPRKSNYTPSHEAYQFYCDLIDGIHKLPNSIEEIEYEYAESDFKIDPISLELSDSARIAYNKFSDYNTDLINGVDNDDFESLFGKLEEYCLRFALILEIMEAVTHKKEVSELTINIEESTIQKAIKLTEYFRSTGVKALNKINRIDPLEKYSKQQRKIFEKLPEGFNKKEGEEIAKEHDMAKRTFGNFIRDKNLFDKVRHGYYEKAI